MLRVALAAALGFTVVMSAMAEDKKETIKGKITCAKCDLGIEKKCAIVVKSGEKVYYFDAAAHKKNHGTYCQTSKEGEVTGTVKKDGDKMVITVEKLTTK